MPVRTTIGAQLWALRNVMQNNPDHVLQQLAVAGCCFIEPAGFNIEERRIQGFSLSDFKKLATRYGFTIPSGHFTFKLQEIHNVCEAATELGMKYIVCPSLNEDKRKTIDSYLQSADELNRMGEIINSYGLRFAYHNHAYEFEPAHGLIPFDVLLDKTESDKVYFQMDMGWVVYSGQSPAEYFNQYPHRFPLWHLRDIEAQTRNTTVLGQGIVNFAEAFSHHQIAGLEYAIVEMASGMENPLEKMIQSIHAVLNET